jgi:hypothetical protein
LVVVTAEEDPIVEGKEWWGTTLPPLLFLGYQWVIGWCQHILKVT